MAKAEDRAREAAQVEEASERAPGMGSALLAVLVMLVSTAILSALIWALMVAIRPIEARGYKKAVEIEAPVIPAPRATHLAS